jgi:hypothetical protein
MFPTTPAEGVGVGVGVVVVVAAVRAAKRGRCLLVPVSNVFRQATTHRIAQIPGVIHVSIAAYLVITPAFALAAQVAGSVMHSAAMHVRLSNVRSTLLRLQHTQQLLVTTLMRSLCRVLLHNFVLGKQAAALLPLLLAVVLVPAVHSQSRQRLTAQYNRIRLLNHTSSMIS